MSDSDPICPLCDRPIPDGGGSLHHLIPKLKGGKGGPTVLLHQICHKEVHATLTEAELARDFSTVAALRAHPRLANFLNWVRKRPPGFRSKVPGKRRGVDQPGRTGSPNASFAGLVSPAISIPR